MHKILQTQLLSAFVANLKIDTIYALYPESFCNRNLAIRKVFTFSDSGVFVLKFMNSPHLGGSKIIGKNIRQLHLTFGGGGDILACH